MSIQFIFKLNSQQFVSYFKAINDQDSRFFQADDDVLYYNEKYVKGELDILFQELNIVISLSEIHKAVMSLKNGKSSGSELLLNEFIKYGNDSFF